MVGYNIFPMISTQVAFRRDLGPPPDGLRSRKKARTRVAIEDAALLLFEGQGYEATTVEQIAECAEVSPTTLFRYFPSKAEIVLSDHGNELPALYEAIAARPRSENDAEAVRRAVQQAWVADRSGENSREGEGRGRVGRLAGNELPAGVPMAGRRDRRAGTTQGPRGIR